MPDPALLAFNFSLGVAAFFSPCGYPMLPAYLAYYLPREGGAPTGLPRAVGRGLAGGALAAAGAVGVLLGLGGLAVLLGAPFKSRLLLLELAGGLLVLGLGVLVLLGRGPSLRFDLRPAQRRSALGLVAFGALYAGVAAGCVAPVFLGVMVQALAAPTLTEGFLVVGAYAAGLAVLLVGVTVLVATAQGAAMAFLKRILPHAERASGWVLVAVGIYLVAYWAYVTSLT